MNKFRLMAKHVNKRGNITPHSLTLITHRVCAKFSKIYLLIGVTDVYNVPTSLHTKWGCFVFGKLVRYTITISGSANKAENYLHVGWRGIHVTYWSTHPVKQNSHTYISNVSNLFTYLNLYAINPSAKMLFLRRRIYNVYV